ncbi:MAG: ATP-binding protein [Chloroflexi bacterium]|nr:ATP-binding protein [Chloroflexota bacterium]
MNESIAETLKKLDAATLRVSSPTTSRSEAPRAAAAGRRHDLPGDPQCEFCGGVGYLREDLPPGHPHFGELQICVCRQANVRAQMRERLFSLSNLDQLQKLTFETFEPRGRIGLGQQQQASLEVATNQARNFAGNLQGWLLLQGGYGCGKTHLAAAIANFASEMGVPCLFITVPDLLDSLRSAYGAQDVTFEERFEEIRRCPLLVLDDFGTQNATEWAQEKLFQILNYRYINRLPLVVTTNLALEEIEGRMRSRLEDPALVTQVRIVAPDYRRPMDDTGHPELSSLALHAAQTFGTFSLRKGENLPAEDVRSLENAFRAAQEFAEEPAGWLVFSGPFGCGKTHLGAAIANYRSSQGHPTLFVVVPDLLDHLRATFNPGSNVTYDRRFEEVRSTRLLVLDDLGTQSITHWAKEKLYQLFNFRYNARLPTVITTADTLDEIDPRLRERLLDKRLCSILPITVPGYRGGGAPRKRSTARKR